MNRLGKFTRCLIALIRAFRHRLFHHGIKRARDRHVQDRWCQRLFAQHLVHDGAGGAGEGFLAGQELVQDHAAGEQVTAAIHRLSQKLLGRHVGRRAHHCARLREFGFFHPCNAEISNLDLAVVEHNQIGRLDVAVDHTVCMGVAEGSENLAHDALDISQGKTLIALEILTQLAALNKFHRDVGHLFGWWRSTRHQGRVFVFHHHFAVVVHRHHTRMVQPSGGLGFTLEARQHISGFGRIEPLLQDGLDRHCAFDLLIEPFIHHAHRAFAEFTADQVFAQLGEGGHGGCQCGVVGIFAKFCCRWSRCADLPRANPRCAYLYLASISHTVVWIRRCTMVSSPTPPLAPSDTPITLVAAAPTSIFNSL